MRTTAVLIITTSILTASSVSAQPVPASLTLSVSSAEAQQILGALGERPWKEVSPLMNKLIEQLNTQLRPPAPPPATDGDKK
jgi:hypothetical protein